MKFEDYYIAPQIKENLSKMGFRRPTDIQFKSIPPILRGEDVLAVAQTGTGKTAAFAIPVLNLLQKFTKSKRPDGIRCLVMVPTHELAIQVAEVFQAIARKTGLKIAAIYGGVDQDPQIKKLNDGVDVLVCTPGRMFDLNSQGYIRLNRLKILILDEADHMLDLGFIKDIRDLIKFLPKSRQTLFFSATINEKIKKLAYSLVNNPVRIQISPKNPVSRNVDHSVAFIEMDDKRFFLKQLIDENPDSKILVFVRTMVRAERVKKAMARVETDSKTIHRDKTQEERFEIMSAYKNSEFKILIATDINARGLDIPDVDIVVNYDLPDKVENYVHRVGRTGRGSKRGKAFSFCSETEKETLAGIEYFLGKQIKVFEIQKGAYRETLDSQSAPNKLEDLMKDIESFKNKKKKKKKK